MGTTLEKRFIERARGAVARAVLPHFELPISLGEGATIVAGDGRQFIDFSGGLGCLPLGHAHPRVTAAISGQAAKFTHTDFSVVGYEVYVALAERLLRLAPLGSEGKVAFFNAGVEAVENSVKFARAFTGRPAVLCFEGAFHGRTLLGMTLTSRVRPFKAGYGPFAPEVYRIPFPNAYRMGDAARASESCLTALEHAFVSTVDPASVAAVIVEPVQGEGGFIVPPDDFLPGLASRCREHGILLIADEIQCGFGRTGRFFACEHFGVQPDLLLVGKAIAAGLPLSGVIGRAEIMDTPAPGTIGGTYVGNPVACAAALATLDVMEEEGLVARVEDVGCALRNRLEALAAIHPAIGDVRGLGAMLAMELVRDRETREPAPELARRMVDEAASRGLVIVSCGLYGNVLRFFVPLNIDLALLEEGLKILGASAAAALG
ncbi:MAG: 4-aminobutyrate--2-oxoglutarate transaminase [Actinomycetota bacterium]